MRALGTMRSRVIVVLGTILIESQQSGSLPLLGGSTPHISGVTGFSQFEEYAQKWHKLPGIMPAVLLAVQRIPEVSRLFRAAFPIPELGPLLPLVLNYGSPIVIPHLLQWPLEPLYCSSISVYKTG